MKNILLLIFIFIGTQVLAQDVLFTQYTSSPLTLNPANSGLINGDMRVSANYRNDWKAVIVPFITSVISYDMALLKGKLNGSSLGIGLLGVYSESGDGNQSSLSTGLSLAYHQKLGSNVNRPHTFSVGTQLQYVQQKRYVPDYMQFGGSEPMQPIDPFFDFNIGIMYNGFITPRATIYSGVSVFHINEPSARFGTNGTYANFPSRAIYIKPRISYVLGGSYELNNKFTFYYSGNLNQDEQWSDLNFGGFIGYNLTTKKLDERNRSSLFLGSWYRPDISISPYLGMEVRRFRLGLSYEIGTSSDRYYNQGGFELSLIYNGNFGRNRSFASNQSIPKF